MLSEKGRTSRVAVKFQQNLWEEDFYENEELDEVSLHADVIGTSYDHGSVSHSFCGRGRRRYDRSYIF